MSQPDVSPERSIKRKLRNVCVVGALETVPDRGEVHFLRLGLVLDLDVGAVEGDVAPYELHAANPVIPRELARLVTDLAP